MLDWVELLFSMKLCSELIHLSSETIRICNTSFFLILLNIISGSVLYIGQVSYQSCNREYCIRVEFLPHFSLVLFILALKAWYIDIDLLAYRLDKPHFVDSHTNQCECEHSTYRESSQ